MRKLKVLILAAVMLCSVCLFASCQFGFTSSEEGGYKAYYTINFEVDGGSEIETVRIKAGESIDLNDYVTEKTGFYFYSWCLNAEHTDRAPDYFTPDRDITLYAEWGSNEKFLLKFDTGDGSRISAQFYAPREYLVKPEDPVLDGYVFAGWYKDPEYTREFNFFGYTMPSKSITIYAKWNPVYAIHFDTIGGSDVESIVGEPGDAVTAPEAPTKAGYVFEGWFTDRAGTEAYTFSTIPEETLTVYAKWHEQIKDITVNLHINSEFTDDVTYSLTGDEGEAFDDAEAIAQFLETLAEELKPYFLDQTLDIVANPVYKFNGWAMDAEGNERYDGVIPMAEGEVDLYATWARSSKYCLVTFTATDEGQADTEYYVVKNTAIPETVLKGIEDPLIEEYESIGCSVDGFYTNSGLRYVNGQKVVMDMTLSPYVYSLDLVYQYVAMSNASGSTSYGYAVMGYDPDSTVATKENEELVLIVPEYYNDGENGSLPVLWINQNAFKDYPVVRVTLPKRLLGLGSYAFSNTKIESISIPATVFELDDYVFAGCTALDEITFKGTSIAWVGSKVYEGTPYEAQLPRDEDGFIYFNDSLSIVYGYEGEATEITIPNTVNIIAGGAFKGDELVKKLTFGANVRLVCSYAFEESALEEVVLGKAFRSMGEYIFRNCTSLKTVDVEPAVNLQYLGTGMFYGCTALKKLDLANNFYVQQFNPYALYGCKALSSLSICRGVTSIYGTTSYFVAVYDYALAECDSLLTISFPTSIQYFGPHAFESSGIGSMALSNTLTEIGEYAFADCDNLVAVNFRAITITALNEGVFKDCDNLFSVIAPDTVTEVKDAAFENCKSLYYVNFGVGASSALTKLGNRVFANCTSLRKIGLFGQLIGDEPVLFGEKVFDNAGYMLDGVFTNPVIYVKAGAPGYSATSKWKNGNVMYSYVEIYKKAFEGTEYEGFTVKPIDSIAPTITITEDVLYLETGDELKEIDLLAYFREKGLFTVTDNDSASEKCEVYISKVTHVANGAEATVPAKDGKYDISAEGTYAVTIAANDEYGNTSTASLQIVVSKKQ